MQYNFSISILYFIFSLTVLFASPLELFPQEVQHINTIHTSSNKINNLQISLLTDKESYFIGDEIHFEVIFFNPGNSPFRIIINDTFVGENIKFTDMQGNKYSYRGGYNSWSTKAGLFPGRTYLLKPNQKVSIRMDALVYDNYQLIFSNLFDSKGSNNYEEFKKKKKLPSNFPDKYICAGRIFSLMKPNKYRLTYIYETSNSDMHWNFATKTPQESSVDLLLIGKVTSNTINILIQ